MRVGVQRHAPAALPPEKKIPVPFIFLLFENQHHAEGTACSDYRLFMECVRISFYVRWDHLTTAWRFLSLPPDREGRREYLE